jgi:hypothetical protein
MSWCSQCSKCSKCSQWFHTVIHFIKTIFMYGDQQEPYPPIPPTVYTVNMKTYSHPNPTSPTKRSSRNTYIDELNIV